MSNTLWEKVNYKSKCTFLIDKEIYEYDISKANISVLYENGVIDTNMYNYLYNAPKNTRSVIVGKLQGRDRKVTEVLKQGIANARRIFLESNHIDDSNIIAIRNDAITYVGRVANVVDTSPYVHFRQSGKYTSFYRINYIDFLYNFDIVTQYENLDVKGLGDNATHLHMNYMLEFLSELFYSAQIEGVKNALILLQMFRDNYINMKLDIGYYRELNPGSHYKFLNMSQVSYLYTDFLTNYDKKYIDISFNEAILREFIKIYSFVLFGK